MRPLILMTFLLSVSQIHAQDLNEKDVPENLKASLLKNGSIRKAKWNKEGSDFEASFKKDGKEQSIAFDSAGNVLETEVEITKKELPAFIIQILKKEYPDYTLEEIATIKSSQGLQYEVKIEKGEISYELLFDLEKLVKKIKESEG